MWLCSNCGEKNLKHEKACWNCRSLRGSGGASLLRDLFRPKWKHSNPAMRFAAIARLTDQNALAKIAKTDANQSVRQAAVERLTDENLLAEIALSDTEYVVRQAAVEKLTDQALLADIAQPDKENPPSLHGR